MINAPTHLCYKQVFIFNSVRTKRKSRDNAARAPLNKGAILFCILRLRVKARYRHQNSVQTVTSSLIYTKEAVKESPVFLTRSISIEHWADTNWQPRTGQWFYSRTRRLDRCWTAEAARCLEGRWKRLNMCSHGPCSLEWQSISPSEFWMDIFSAEINLTGAWMSFVSSPHMIPELAQDTFL